MATGRSQKICLQTCSHATLPRAAFGLSNPTESAREHQDRSHRLLTTSSWKQHHSTFAIFYGLEASQEVQCTLGEGISQKPKYQEVRIGGGGHFRGCLPSYNLPLKLYSPPKHSIPLSLNFLNFKFSCLDFFFFATQP